MELLWFMNPSLGADYGTFYCVVCGDAFYYSPRLTCHCNRCAMRELAALERSEADAGQRATYRRAYAMLEEL
ncbi:hypothetical protein [Chitinophaga caseinilytica]|uniref:C2H2-type domain-containing protein n=1 Tax=Chitinophaga caseinilytica TaxID=2267521 RepID=A0ABZ2YYZ2_9BACT